MNDSFDPEIVYVFKSTYYPDFRRKILSALSLPNGSQYDIEYDDKWFSEDMKNQPERFKGKTAYLIFMDFSTTPTSFYPLRRCKILDITRGGAALFRVTIEVENYKISANPEDFSKNVRDYLKRRMFMENNRVLKLVLSGDDSIEKELSEKTKQEDTWEEIVEHLVSADEIEVPPGSGMKQVQFKKSLFYQLRVVDKEKLRILKVSNGSYKFETGKEYAIRFSVYQPHYHQFSSEAAELAFASETKYVRHVGKSKMRMPLNQRTYSKYFDFWVNNVMWGGKSKLIIERRDDEFNAPLLSIPFSLPKNVLKICIFFGFLTSGLLMLGSPSLFAKNIGLQEMFWSFLGAILSSGILTLLEIQRNK